MLSARSDGNLGVPASAAPEHGTDDGHATGRLATAASVEQGRHTARHQHQAGACDMGLAGPAGPLGFCVCTFMKTLCCQMQSKVFICCCVYIESIWFFHLQTIYVTVNMRSPTIVIPEYGSLHREGSMLVIDLGQFSVVCH